MIDNIKNKSILLISTNFYNYDVAVKEALLQLGAKSVILKNAISFRGSLREHDYLEYSVLFNKRA